MALAKTKTLSALTALSAVLVFACACTGGDSTVSKTPTNTIASPTQDARPSQGTRERSKPPPSPKDDCAVNVKDPAIAAAVALLPPGPNSEVAWNPVPVAGNYNKCAPLSAVIVTTAGGPTRSSADSATRAVFFHLGSVISRGVPDTYGYNAIDLSASTSDTVVLNFSNGIPGLDSVVSFRWNGSGVEKVQQVGQ